MDGELSWVGIRVGLERVFDGIEAINHFRALYQGTSFSRANKTR
jgi:hypothetical protein